MYVDAITLAAIADEWRKLLVGGRIDTVIQPTEHAVALQCYAPGTQEGQGGKNRWIYLSAHPQLARAHITALKPQRIAHEPPAFVMLLRKHLEGARIEAIVQPGWERVIEIVAGYRKDAESDERIRFRLIIEIMGRLSNIIFCDEQGIILGSLKRVGADVNRYRVIATGMPYVPPPPMQRTIAGQTLPRLIPGHVTASQLVIAAGDETPAPLTEKKRKRNAEAPKVWQLLPRQIAGFSPLLAREAVYRTTEDAETLLTQTNPNTWEELAWHINDLAQLYQQKHWQPRLIERQLTPEELQNSLVAPGAESYVPQAFAAYLLEQYSGRDDIRIQESASINVVLDEYFARAEWRDALDGLRAPIRKALQTNIDRCLRKADLLRQEMVQSEEAARYRLYGDLLLAHQHEVGQGPTSVVLLNYFDQSGSDEASQISVPLDPRFDAVTNANRYFNKYHKLRRALELVPTQIEQNNLELAMVSQFMSDLKIAENSAEITHVQAEVQAAGYMRGSKVVIDKKALKAAKKIQGKGKGGKPAKGKPVPPGGGVPLHIQSREGFTLLVGKNSRQNEEVTFRQATSNDLWLHARGVAGAHVIIKSAGREIPHNTINQAASLAAYYSEARGTTSASVDYTLQRHVRHMKGGGPGMVIYEREHTIYVEPDKAIALLKA